MGFSFGRNGLLATTAIVAIAAASPALAQTKRFDVPAQSATTGIAALGQQADIQILAARKDTGGRRTRSVHGDMTIEQALTRLLDGTGLTARKTGPQTFSVVPASGAATAGNASDPEPATGGAGAEIVVTAEKRAARIETVPVSVSVIQASAMERRHVTQIADYLGTVPGLSANISDQGKLGLAIRGITTGQGGGNPTVGVTVDDVPVGASAGLAAGFVPELDPNVLSTIEVLRGPQGTLYGASSMGGCCAM